MLKFTKYVFLTCLVNLFCKSEMIKFKKSKVNASENSTFSHEIKNKYLIRELNVRGLIHCSSYCASLKNCDLFNIKLMKMEVFRFKCETYSSMSYDSILNLKEPLESVYVKFRESNDVNSVETNQDLYSYSDIEKNDFSMKVESSIKSTLSSSSLISSTLSSTTITTSMQTSSTTLDFSCSNSVCICKDTLSFYSTIQQKCINCRPEWLPYKNVCYKSFSELRKWADYVSYCASLNSTLLIADDPEKFDFFRNVSKNIPQGLPKRTFVNAKITTANVYQWMNNKPINVSYFGTSIALSLNYCFAYSSISNFLLQTAICSSGTSNGICEYSE